MEALVWADKSVREMAGSPDSGEEALSRGQPDLESLVGLLAASAPPQEERRDRCCRLDDAFQFESSFDQAIEVGG